MTPGKIPDDAALQVLYREASAHEMPDAKLDAAILAAARTAATAQATAKKPRPDAWWKRWLVPVSVTAVAVLGVSLTLRVSEEQAALEQSRQKARDSAPDTQGQTAGRAAPAERVAPTVREESISSKTITAIGQPKTLSASGSEANSAANSTSGSVADSVTNSAARSAANEVSMPARPVSPQPASQQPTSTPPQSAPASLLSAPKAAVPAAPAVLQDTPTRSSEFESKKERAEESHVAPAAEAAATATHRAKKVEADATLGAALSSPEASVDLRKSAPARARQNKSDESLEANPERWLEHIRSLRQRGQDAEARAQLDRFRARYPDFVRPPDLQ